METNIYKVSQICVLLAIAQTRRIIRQIHHTRTISVFIFWDKVKKRGLFFRYFFLVWNVYASYKSLKQQTTRLEGRGGLEELVSPGKTTRKKRERTECNERRERRAFGIWQKPRKKAWKEAHTHAQGRSQIETTKRKSPRGCCVVFKWFPAEKDYIEKGRDREK